MLNGASNPLARDPELKPIWLTPCSHGPTLAPSAGVHGGISWLRYS